MRGDDRADEITERTASVRGKAAPRGDAREARAEKTPAGGAGSEDARPAGADGPAPANAAGGTPAEGPPSAAAAAAGPSAAPREPGYAIEEQLAAAGAGRIAGIDEVGRGAWAGPVVVCAAVTDLSPPPAGLTDSKMLTARRRAAIAAELAGWLAAYAFGSAGPEEIDEVGMTEALRRAAVRALEALPRRPDAIILDGKHNFLGRGSSGGGRPWPVRTEIKADLRSVSVAAASVLAKVHRDTLMAGLGHEEYGFADNAGYPSPVHQEALRRLGPTPHHRLSWSYLDDLPEWRHLKRHRPDIEGQLSLI